MPISICDTYIVISRNEVEIREKEFLGDLDEIAKFQLDEENLLLVYQNFELIYSSNCMDLVEPPDQSMGDLLNYAPDPNTQQIQINLQ